MIGKIIKIPLPSKHKELSHGDPNSLTAQLHDVLRRIEVVPHEPLNYSLLYQIYIKLGKAGEADATWAKYLELKKR